MKLVLSSLVVLLVAVTGLSSSAAAAWDITSRDTTTPTTILGPHQEFVRVWTIAGDHAVDQLRVHTLGPVFVDLDPALGPGNAGNASVPASDSPTSSTSTSTGTSDATTTPRSASEVVAQVALSGDSKELLEAIEVRVDASGHLEVHFANADFDGRGFLLTEITVNRREALTSLSLEWAADVTIGEGVLAASSNASVNLLLAGSGDLFVDTPTTAYALSSLSTTVAGSGDVQFVARAIEVDDALAVSVAGSGDVGVVASEAIHVGDSLLINVAGSGDVTVQSPDVTSRLLETGVAGSGDVTLSHGGRCDEQHVIIAGSGDVATGSIACVNTDIKVVGSGDVLVQTTGNLSVLTAFSSSDIKYFGPEPTSISVSGGIFRRVSKHHGPKHTNDNDYDKYKVQPIPPRTPEHVEVHLRSSFFSDEPSSHGVVLSGWPDDRHWAWGWSTQDLSAHVSHPAMALVVIFAGVALLTVGVATHNLHTRHVRRAYRPLL